MFSKKLLGTIGVLAATALAPATAAQAAQTDTHRGTQVGSEGIIAILIGATAPREPHLAHGCPNCPHPASIATDGIGVGIEPTSIEYPNI